MAKQSEPSAAAASLAQANVSPVQAPSPPPPGTTDKITIKALESLLFGDTDTKNIIEAIKLFPGNDQINENTVFEVTHVGKTPIIKPNETEDVFYEAINNFYQNKKADEHIVARAIVLNIIFAGKTGDKVKTLENQEIIDIAKSLYRTLPLVLGGEKMTITKNNISTKVFVKLTKQVPAKLQDQSQISEKENINPEAKALQDAQAAIEELKTNPKVENKDKDKAIAAINKAIEANTKNRSPLLEKINELTDNEFKKELIKIIEQKPKGGAQRKRNVVLNGQKKKYCVYKDDQGRKFIKYKQQTYLTSIRGKFKYV